MAQLLVRGIEPDLVSRLKVRAAKEGHSAEEEHRRILRAALVEGPAEPLRDLLLAMPEAGSDRDFGRPPDRGRGVEL